VERRAGVGAPYNKRNSNFMQKYFHEFVVVSLNYRNLYLQTEKKTDEKTSHPMYYICGGFIEGGCL